MTDRQETPGPEGRPVVDTWVDSEDILKRQIAKRREAGKLAAIDHAAAEWFDRIDDANHFRQRWRTITKRGNL